MKWRQARITTKWSSPTHLAHFLSPSLLFDQQTIPHCEFVNCETVKICSPFLFATDKKLVYTLPCSIIGSENLIWHSVFQSENRERESGAFQHRTNNQQNPRLLIAACHFHSPLFPRVCAQLSAMSTIYIMWFGGLHLSFLFSLCSIPQSVKQQPSLQCRFSNFLIIIIFSSSVHNPFTYIHLKQWEMKGELCMAWAESVNIFLGSELFWEGNFLSFSMFLKSLIVAKGRMKDEWGIDLMIWNLFFC